MTKWEKKQLKTKIQLVAADSIPAQSNQKVIT